LVLGEGDALAVHGPLVPAQLRVEAPMDEHTEASLVPPAHAGRARGGGLLNVLVECHVAPGPIPPAPFPVREGGERKKGALDRLSLVPGRTRRSAPTSPAGL